jgi:GT2 family glycosyltransferase
MTSQIYCIVVNWNGWRETLRCIASLRTAAFPQRQIVVVDNGSTDESLTRLSAALQPPRERLIAVGANLGFTGGANVGLRLALDEGVPYALLLNNDATVAPDCLATLLDAAEQQPEAGFLGPRILWNADRGRIWSAGISVTWRQAAFDDHRDEPDGARHAARRIVDGLSGCALLVRRSVLERVGLLDERYFAYYEDLDWCLRGARAGFSSLYVGDAVAYHAGSATANRGAGRSQSTFINYYGARNALLCIALHAPPRERPLALARLSGSLLAAEVRILAGGLLLRRPQATRRARAIAAGVLDAARGHFGARQGISA